MESKPKPKFASKMDGILNGEVRCPKYIESFYDILDYLLWLRLNGYQKGYGCDSLDEDENGKHIAYQTNEMYNCIKDLYFSDDEEGYEHESEIEHMIRCLEGWIEDLFEENEFIIF